ncbi:MAG: DUF2807 domain-containing protein [Bacteroidota bacterium]
MKAVNLLVLLLSVFLTSNIQAQRSTRIDGNGNLKTIKRNLSSYAIVRLDMVVDAEFVPSDQNFVEITADENVLDRILTTVNRNILSINQDGWVEASQTVKVTIGYQDITSIINSAWGTANLSDFEGPELWLEAEVGTIVATGTVYQLHAKAKVGTIKATGLKANTVNVDISGTGTVKVDVVESLNIGAMDRGKVVYVNTPANIKAPEITDGILVSLEKEAALPKAQYIHVTLKNNRYKKTPIRIEGPTQAPFGYGTTLAPLGKRKEKFPVGTKIYKGNGHTKADLLVVIGSEDANQVVQLFE